MTPLKASLVVLAALGALALMRRGSAARRHWLLAAAVLCSALIPVVEPIAPGWGLRWIADVQGFSAGTAADRSVLRAIWTGGVAAGIASLVLGFGRVLRLASRSAREDVDAYWQPLVLEIGRDFGIARTVRVIESAEPVMPVTWGLRRPTIVIPAAARTWSRARQHAVLSHELAHIRRGDWAMQIAVEIATAVYWFNPLFWIARRRVRLESDRACDDLVLGLGVSGADYAGELVNVARALRGRRDAWAAAPAMIRARGRALERRVAAALDGDLDRTPANAGGCAATLGFLLCLTMSIAGFGTEAAAPASAFRVSEVQRNIMERLGAEDRRLSFVTGDVSFWNNRIEGRVELQARLGVDGSLSLVRVVEPVHPDVAMAAAAIARQWRREPARVRGVPVEVPIRMTIDFHNRR